MGGTEPFDELELARAAHEGGEDRATLLERYAGVLEDALVRLQIGDKERETILERALGSLARFEGKGSLASWLRAAVARAAAELGDDDDEGNTTGDFWRSEDPTAEASPEVAATVSAALATAADSLTPRQRNVLRFHLNDGLGLDEIGAIYRATRAEVARELSRARETLLDGARQHVSSHGDPALVEEAHTLIDTRLDAVAQERFSTIRDRVHTDPERPSARVDAPPGEDEPA